MKPIDAFLLGFIVMACLVAATFFLKFWRKTGDFLFAAFAIFFILEGSMRITLLFSAKPNEALPSSYVLQLIGLVIVLTAILRKNLGRGRKG